MFAHPWSSLFCCVVLPYNEAKQMIVCQRSVVFVTKQRNTMTFYVLLWRSIKLCSSVLFCIFLSSLMANSLVFNYSGKTTVHTFTHQKTRTNTRSGFSSAQSLSCVGKHYRNKCHETVILVTVHYYDGDEKWYISKQATHKHENLWHYNNIRWTNKKNYVSKKNHF